MCAGMRVGWGVVGVVGSLSAKGTAKSEVSVEKEQDLSLGHADFGMLFDIQVEMSSQLLGIWTWSLGARSGLEVRAWKH